MSITQDIVVVATGLDGEGNPVNYVRTYWATHLTYHEMIAQSAVAVCTEWGLGGIEISAHVLPQVKRGDM